MPLTRRRQVSATEIAEDEEENLDAPGTGLKFNESLTWRAGKPIPVGELLRRLEVLSRELCDMDQDDATRESLLPIAKELAAPQLLGHKDAGVRAWTARCIVDIFRLCAPDAPYTASQLRDIFVLIVTKILPALADPSSPYNSQHIKVVKSLGEVKSIVLLSDIPSANSVLLQLFTTCFDILSGPTKADGGEELPKDLENWLTTLLAVLVDESQSLPNEVVDVVIAQFLRADPKSVGGAGSKPKKGGQADDKQMTLLLKEAPPAYNMAKNICNFCADKMARYISLYFSSVIVGSSALNGKPAAKSRRKPSDDDTDGSDDEAQTAHAEGHSHETSKAHRLLRELWRSASDVVQNVIPQLEAELSAEDIELRLLATETIGDMVSGIGAAGLPQSSVLNPTAYPSQSLESGFAGTHSYNFLTTPTSPHSFPSLYPQAYESFISRRKDKSPVIRSAWVTCVGRIIVTSAGGVGLDPDQEQKLLHYLSDMLVDGDEKVRLAAVKAIERFQFKDIVQKLGSTGSVSQSGSVLCNLADRVKDRKGSVRTEAMNLLGRIWGVAAGAISEGSERVTDLLGLIPSRIFETYYVNDLEINALVDHVLFESLLPLNYPPIKIKTPHLTNGAPQGVMDSQGSRDKELTESDLDRLRAERMLLLVRDLEPKAKKVFFARQGHQAAGAKYMDAFLRRCEEYNGGVVDHGEKEIKQQLSRLIDYYSKTLPDPARAAEDLWKFAKMHDRRSYQLIRFCISPDSEYKKVQRSIRELAKRMGEASGTSGTLMDILALLLYRSSVLLYNRSHVPAIIEFSRTDKVGLGVTAHEVLKEISTHNPEIFRAHVKDLCASLENDTPSAGKANASGAVEDLKACAGFARRFPNEIPQDRKFFKSMVNFVLYGEPPKAAKHAVSVIMASADRKEIYAKDMLRDCLKDFKFGSGKYLTRLAALSQLMLSGSKFIEDEIDSVIDVAINQVLLKVRNAADSEATEWQENPDDECASKMWALKILVNHIRSFGDQVPTGEVAQRVFTLLNTLIEKEGELSKSNNSPKAHRSRLRLLAAQSILKLCSTKRLDGLLTAKDFNRLATVAQDPLPPVRAAFVTKLMKYLGQGKLPSRFYTVVFLLAFEPRQDLKESALTWIRARAAALARQKDTTMETLFARLLSLLAHHPDFDRDVDNLRDFTQYIMFYLKAVATEQNLPLIYHVAQRVKSVQDATESESSENLYCLSDLSQAVIRRFEESKGWSMQAWPGRLKLPATLFAPLPSHAVAQEIATKQFVPDELLEELEDVVKLSLRPRKRKSDVQEKHRSTKRRKSSIDTHSLPLRKVSKPNLTPKARKDKSRRDPLPSSERRRSGRNAANKNYAEQDDSQDDADMEMWDRAGKAAKDDEAGGSSSDEAHSESDTERPPPTTSKHTRRNGATTGKTQSKGPSTAAKRALSISSDPSEEELSDPPDSDDAG